MRTVLLVAVLTALAFAEHGDPLSDKDHNKVISLLRSTKEGPSRKRNKYDHDAFLGKDTAAEYDDLTPEKSKERLAIEWINSLRYYAFARDGRNRIA
uniref:RxLR effector protein n=1 Tax=Parascaris equorum TaxID=6256 RepID=A0A914RAR7_PAREQ